MPEWSAEVMVDENLARRLVDEQFPQLGLSSIRLLGEGRDNTAWLVDGEWVFRFPRRSAVVLGIENVQLTPDLESLPPWLPCLRGLG